MKTKKQLRQEIEKLKAENASLDFTVEEQKKLIDHLSRLDHEKDISLKKKLCNVCKHSIFAMGEPFCKLHIMTTCSNFKEAEKSNGKTN